MSPYSFDDLDRYDPPECRSCGDAGCKYCDPKIAREDDLLEALERREGWQQPGPSLLDT